MGDPSLIVPVVSEVLLMYLSFSLVRSPQNTVNQDIVMDDVEPHRLQDIYDLILLREKNQYGSKFSHRIDFKSSYIMLNNKPSPVKAPSTRRLLSQNPRRNTRILFGKEGHWWVPDLKVWYGDDPYAEAWLASLQGTRLVQLSGLVTGLEGGYSTSAEHLLRINAHPRIC